MISTVLSIYIYIYIYIYIIYIFYIFLVLQFSVKIIINLYAKQLDQFNSLFLKIHKFNHFN